MGVPSAALQAWIRANQRASWAVLRRLPHAHVNVHRDYVRLIAEMLARNPVQVVADVGAGRTCHFARAELCPPTIRIIALDIDPGELALNEEASEKVIADASEELPLDDATVDLVVSSSTVEHLRDVDRFIEESRRVLRPGGYVVHVFPSKFAPYAIINRLLTPRLAQRVLRIVFPGTEGILGFRAYYHRCHARGIRKSLERCGFDVVETRASYQQAYYFAFFFPLFLLMVAWDLAGWALGAKAAAAGLLIVARRPAEVGATAPQELRHVRPTLALLPAAASSR